MYHMYYCICRMVEDLNVSILLCIYFSTLKIYRKLLSYVLTDLFMNHTCKHDFLPSLCLSSFDINQRQLIDTIYISILINNLAIVPDEKTLCLPQICTIQEEKHLHVISV